MSGYFQCRGCLQFLPPSDLQPCEVYSIIVGEKYWVILCPECLENYRDWDMLVTEDAENENLTAQNQI